MIVHRSSRAPPGCSRPPRFDYKQRVGRRIVISGAGAKASAQTPPPEARRRQVFVDEIFCAHHAAVAFEDGTILVVGGQDSNERLLKDYFLYRPDSDRWERRPLPFRPRIEPGLLATGP